MFLNFNKAVALTTKNTSPAGHWQLEIQKRVQTEKDDSCNSVFEVNVRDA